MRKPKHHITYKRGQNFQEPRKLVIGLYARPNQYGKKHGKQNGIETHIWTRN